jgi:pyruvate formate lyase activating enzyme
MLPIVGHQSISLVDFPGKISTVFFFAGCDLRCPYCHNESLFSFKIEDIIPKEQVLEEIIKRSQFVDGVVFTGGEPSLYDELIDLFKEIKEKTTLEIKLDTNGLNPEFIQKAAEYIDCIAIDLKTTPDMYCELGSKLTESDIRCKLSETKSILEDRRTAKVEYRTTMYPPLIESYERLYKMFEFIPQNAEYYLQKFVNDNAWNTVARKTASYSEDQLERMVLEVRRNTRKENVFVRTYL